MDSHFKWAFLPWRLPGDPAATVLPVTPMVRNQSITSSRHSHGRPSAPVAIARALHSAGQRSPHRDLLLADGRNARNRGEPTIDGVPFATRSASGQRLIGR